MVLAVNPPTSGDQTASAFKEKAKSVPKTAAAPSSISSTTPSSTLSQGSSTATTSPANGATQDQTNGYLHFILAAIVMGLLATWL